MQRLEFLSALRQRQLPCRPNHHAHGSTEGVPGVHCFVNVREPFQGSFFIRDKDDFPLCRYFHGVVDHSFESRPVWLLPPEVKDGCFPSVLWRGPGVQGSCSSKVERADVPH